MISLPERIRAAISAHVPVPGDVLGYLDKLEDQHSAEIDICHAQYKELEAKNKKLEATTQELCVMILDRDEMLQRLQRPPPGEVDLVLNAVTGVWE